MHTLSALSAYPATFRHIRRLAALAALTAAAGAHAGGGVSWSVNVDMPMAPMGRVVTAVSNVPAPVVVYRSEPVYVQQQPVYVQQQPVYQGPSRVVYAPAPVMVVSEPRRCPPPVWWGHGHERREWRESRWDRWDRGGERIMIVPGVAAKAVGMAARAATATTATTDALQRRRLVLPPRMEPSTPRMISRPTDEPMVRAADLATVSRIESLRPLPLSTLPARSPSQPPDDPAA